MATGLVMRLVHCIQYMTRMTGPWWSPVWKKTRPHRNLPQEQEERKITPRSFHVNRSASDLLGDTAAPHVTITIRSASYNPQKKSSFLMCVKKRKSSDRRTRHALKISRPLSSPRASHIPSSLHKNFPRRTVNSSSSASPLTDPTVF